MKENMNTALYVSLTPALTNVIFLSLMVFLLPLVPNKRMMCNANFLKKIGAILDFKGPDILLIFAANFLLSLCSKFGE